MMRLYLRQKVIRYDSQGIFSAPRALFMFRSFGHEKSSVLDGGLPGWETEGLPTETGPANEISRSQYPAPTLVSENLKSEFLGGVLSVPCDSACMRL